MDNGTTDRPAESGRHLIENTKTSMVYWFEDGSHVSEFAL
jgi:hypothetical protein